MTMQGVEAVRADREALIELGNSLSEDEWALPSDCAGWSVKDVYTHLWLSFERLLNPDAYPASHPDDVERSIDDLVAEYAKLVPADILKNYIEASERGTRRLEKLQSPPTSEIQVKLDNLGTYPVWQLANATAFDHHAHLRLDLVAPGGPLQHGVPPVGELQLAPTIVWMTSGLPQMCEQQLADIQGSVLLRLEGPGGGVWRFENGQFPAADTVADAEVVSTTVEFVIWGTKRRPWRERQVSLGGDEDLGARFCDRVNVI